MTYIDTYDLHRYILLPIIWESILDYHLYEVTTNHTKQVGIQFKAHDSILYEQLN